MVGAMDDHFCPNCGTEVEADARFCPTCGTTLSADLNVEAAGADLPAAPAWPSAEPDARPLADEPPTMTDAAAPPPPASSAAPPAPAPTVVPPPPAAPPMELPITWPTTLSGWLIGAGSLLGAIFLIPRLGSAGYVVSLLLFLALLGIAATSFLADRVPEIPRLRLVVLVTTMIGLGVALARAAFSIAGVDTLFLVAMLAAAGGALLIELDRDRPMPPPPRSGG